MIFIKFIAASIFFLNFSFRNESIDQIKENSKEVKSSDFTVDASGKGDFKTVQEAFNAVPLFKTSQTKIFVKNGIYKEKLELALNKNNVTLIGESKGNVILTYDDYASKSNGEGGTIGTSGSASFIVSGNSFTAQNITFENSSGPVGQAVAVRIDGDKIIFENCKFLGFQDTLYPRESKSRQYYKNCYIEGTTDFIFGGSTAVFEDCEIFSKKGGSYITAANTPESNTYGFVFLNCKLTANSGDSSYYLGRPWRNYARTVFLKCDMGSHIKPQGWHNWGKPEAEKTVLYAEYQSIGKGANVGFRANWSHQLSVEQFKREYSMKAIFNDWKPN
ncbi:pectinesterase family protein [Flavobacterium sp. CFBP9031]|uniref:pectinesterase family protein n=1 Tax=Flavobacterium sp. CFBP9031 TaxID=3096538 RepID=UPI002A6B300E|nr:pectinesterase family protein [Flavobacterium sp. CFBP9031]MDY0986662.1 pectinesterase family protein [Flavobacterium sp. CFBP9031]